MVSWWWWWLCSMVMVMVVVQVVVAAVVVPVVLVVDVLPSCPILSYSGGVCAQSSSCSNTDLTQVSYDHFPSLSISIQPCMPTSHAAVPYFFPSFLHTCMEQIPGAS